MNKEILEALTIIEEEENRTEKDIEIIRKAKQEIERLNGIIQGKDRLIEILSAKLDVFISNVDLELIEDKKIEKINIGYSTLGFDDRNQDIYISKTPENEAFAIKINEIIEVLNEK